MTYLFAIPLVLGVGVNLAAAGIGYIAGKHGKNSVLHDIALNLYYSGIATLTASSMLRGIFDIAGTASIYQTYLMYAGLAMTIGGAVIFLLGLFFRRLH
jgi:hypothetical protein